MPMAKRMANGSFITQRSHLPILSNLKAITATTINAATGDIIMPQPADLLQLKI